MGVNVVVTSDMAVYVTQKADVNRQFNEMPGLTMQQ